MRAEGARCARPAGRGADASAGTRPGAPSTWQGVGKVAGLTGQIEAAAAGIGEGDLAQQKAASSSELAALRARQEQNRPAVERILEKQVASVLDELDFTTFGQVFPAGQFPVHREPELPDRLAARPDSGRARRVPRPRDAPERDRADREPGRGRAWTRARIVEGTGGFSSYPTMVLAYSVLELGRRHRRARVDAHLPGAAAARLELRQQPGDADDQRDGRVDGRRRGQPRWSWRSTTRNWCRRRRGPRRCPCGPTG